MNNSARALQDLLQRQRDYAVAAHMIQSLNVRSIRLMTNNPAKVQQLQGYGVQVHGRIPTSSLPTITIASTWRPRQDDRATGSTSRAKHTSRNRAIRSRWKEWRRPIPLATRSNAPVVVMAGALLDEQGAR